MKLLFYTPVDLRAGLGCERWHCDITNSLKSRFNDEIEIVTGNVGHVRWDDEYLKFQLKNTKNTRLEYINWFSSLIPTPKTLFDLYRKFLWADAVHFIHGFIGQDIIMAFLKLLTGKRIVVGHHAPILHTSRVHNLYMNLISRPILKIFDYHMVLNKKDKILLESWEIKNVHFIPSGVRVEKFLKLKRKRHTTLNFLSSGRFDTPQKGFDLAVKAIEIFNKKYPNNNSIFRFLGSGSSIIDNHAFKNKNILNLGFMKYENVPKIYEESDVFLLSSRKEPFGLILVEAWSSGMPVLATKTEGPLDMLKEGKNGWFIEEITAQSISDAVTTIYQRWIKSKKFLRSMETACRQTGKKYNINTTAQKLRSLLSVN